MDYHLAIYNWFKHYSPYKKEIPPRMPIAKEKLVKILAFFDANHAG